MQRIANFAGDSFFLIFRIVKHVYPSSHFHIFSSPFHSEKCKLKVIETDTVEGTNKVAKLEAISRGSCTKSNLSVPENSKSKLPVSSSSSAPSSYLTLKSHLLLMNAPSTSKPNRYKRSHSSISNPESRIKEVVERGEISTEKSSKTNNSQGNIRIYFIHNNIKTK